MIRQILLPFSSIVFSFLFSLLQVQTSFAGQAALRPDQDQQCGLSHFQQDILQMMQTARSQSRKCGSQFFKATSPVRWNGQLAAAAAGHSADMANRNYFDHRSWDGTPFSERVTRAGYRWTTVGENISGGRRSVNEAINAWLQSPPHCANIMSAKFADVGVACVKNAKSTYQYYWTMELGHN
jgi:uncharacterized protein YkwD